MIFTESTPNNLTPNMSSEQTNLNEHEIQNLIRNTEYNILINNPEPQTLTNELISNPTLNPTNSLLHIRNITNHSKISIKAVANNSYIQKLRTIICIVFTQSYESIWSDSETSLSNDEQQPSLVYSKWKYAKDQIRLACYEDNMSPLHMKYMAEFFQFLDYDFENKVKRSLNDEENGREDEKEKEKGKGRNLVIKLLNKYPIIDEILIQLLMRMIKVLCYPVSLDDNLNITKFIEEKLKLSIVFLSNWEFNLEHIKVEIGKNMFTLDNNVNNYFNTIVSNLTNRLEYHGLDVSNVRTPDSHTFTKMDESFICDLAELEHEDTPNLQTMNEDMFNKEIMVNEKKLGNLVVGNDDEERFMFEIERTPILTTSKHSESSNEQEQFEKHHLFIPQQNQTQNTKVISTPSQNSKEESIISQTPISDFAFKFNPNQENQEEKESETQKEEIENSEAPSDFNHNNSTHFNGFDRDEFSEFKIKDFLLNYDKSAITETIRYSSPSIREESLSFAVQNEENQESKGSAIRTTSTREEGHHFISEIYDKQLDTPRNEIMNPEKNEKSFMEICEDIEKIVDNINKNILQGSKEKNTNVPTTFNHLNINKNLLFPEDQTKTELLETDQYVIPDLIRRGNREAFLNGFLSRKSNKSSRNFEKDNSVEFQKNGNHESERQLKEKRNTEIIPQPIETLANQKSNFASFRFQQHQNPINKILLDLTARSDSSLKAKRHGITITQPNSILTEESKISII